MLYLAVAQSIGYENISIYTYIWRVFKFLID